MSMLDFKVDEAEGPRCGLPYGIALTYHCHKLIPFSQHNILTCENKLILLDFLFICSFNLEKIFIIWVGQCLLSFPTRVLLSAVKSEAVSTVISPLFFQAENPHLRIFTLYLLRDPRASLADIKVDCIVWSNLILVRPWQVYFSPHVSAYLSWWWCPGVFRPWESSGRGEGVLSKSMETTVIRRCLLHNLHHHPNHRLARIYIVLDKDKVIQVGVTSKFMETPVD